MNIAPLARGFISVNAPFLPVVHDSSTCKQCFSPWADAFSPEFCRRSFGQATPQLLRSPFSTPRKILGTPAIDGPVVQLTPDRETRIGPKDPGSPHVTPMLDMAHAFTEDSRAHKTGFWDSLDYEDQLSTHSTYSVLSNIKVPFSRAWSLRKERSLIFRSHQLFSLSAVSVQQRLKRRPRSITALKCAAYAKPIADLPSHLSQIGSGIGFTYTASALSQPMVGETTGKICSDSGASSCPLPSVSRNSTSSDSTVAVPNACHGLFHSLRISRFWAGFKTDSRNVPMATMSPPHPRRHCPKILEKTDDMEGPPQFLITGPYKQSKEEEDCRIGISQPWAESTAFLSPILEAPSPTISSSPTGSVTAEDVLTPETIDFPSATVIRNSEIVEIKNSEEARQFCPESTLRLVTPTNRLRLTLMNGPYLL